MTVQPARNSTREWQALDRAHVHPFTDHTALHKIGPRVITKAEGTYLYESGSDPQLQVEMGLFGALVIYPSGVSISAHSGVRSNDCDGSEVGARECQRRLPCRGWASRSPRAPSAAG